MGKVEDEGARKRLLRGKGKRRKLNHLGFELNSYEIIGHYFTVHITQYRYTVHTLYSGPCGLAILMELESIITNYAVFQTYQTNHQCKPFLPLHLQLKKAGIYIMQHI